MTNDLTAPTVKPLLPTKIVMRAIDMMVHDGSHRDEAAKAVGMLPKSLYKALAKPHVKRYFNEQLEVLRTSARARNFHRLEEIREQDSNPMAAVNAIKTLEQLGEEANNRVPGLPTQPGLQIVIVQAPAKQPPIIDIDVVPNEPKDRL